MKYVHVGYYRGLYNKAGSGRLNSGCERVREWNEGRDRTDARFALPYDYTCFSGFADGYV